MSLRQSKFLFVDCQTTGMRPPAGALLELAWAYSSADDEPQIQSHLVTLSEGQEIPARVSEITGIDSASLSEAWPAAEVFAELQKSVCSMAAESAAIIHYARFEQLFLLDLYARFAGSATLPFDLICSHQLCKRLFPELPSQNIRGASGFFGGASGQLKRAGSHVLATQRIWRGIVSELEKLGLVETKQLQEWLNLVPAKKTQRYAYRLDRLKRLELPDGPGIYRMLAKNGDVLYVGKATSLKSRVNSYFRGVKGRDKRKLEMLAQVWDLRVTDCPTPLEAALLESDEIKKFNPPYNVVLKRGGRQILFYNRAYDAAHAQQSAEFPNGPFRQSNWIEHLRLLIRSLGQAEFEQIFFKPINPETLRQGFAQFCAEHALDHGRIRGVRTLLAQGMWILKNHVEVEETPAEDEPEEDEEREPSVEEIAAKFARLLRRAAAEVRRSRKLTRLLNARIRLKYDGGHRELVFNAGVLGDAQTYPGAKTPWRNLTIDDFDRMSILESELKKYENVLILTAHTGVQEEASRSPRSPQS